jgi:hypothetical protein
LLIDVHAAPQTTSPKAFAEAAKAAGLHGVVITASNLDKWSDYADAFDDLGLVPFMGIALPLTRGTLVFVPRNTDDEALDAVDWSAPTGGFEPADAVALVRGLAGVTVATHPYFRDVDPALGDRIYGLKGVGGVVTRVGDGKLTWDLMADGYAAKCSIARLGSAGGSVNVLGRAATVFPDGIETQDGLVDAIEAGQTLPVELDDPASPRDRRGPPPAPPRREQSDRDDRGGRDDRGDRGGRDRGGRGGRR